MGQTYDVTYTLRIKDRQGLIDAINAYIDETDKDGLVIWPKDWFDRTDLTSLMKLVITDRGFEEFDEEEEVVFSSSFDASYGWEAVMMEVFECMAPHLEDGSMLEIWPDYGKDFGTVKSGQVKWHEDAR